MNIDEQTRHPKTEWYKKLTIYSQERKTMEIQLYCGIQNSAKEDLNWRKKKQLQKIRFLTKNKEDINQGLLFLSTS